MKYDKQFHMRQDTLISKQALSTPITVIGAGGIGSHTILALARMGYFNITVYDMDEVSAYNLNNQGFDIEDIGKNKAVLMKEKVKRAIGFDITAEPEQFSGETHLEGIVIAAVDSMATRKLIFSASLYADLFINPAMGAEYAKINCYRPRKGVIEHEKFEKDWYSDDDANPEACTAKSTIYTTNLIAGFICKIVKDYTHHAAYVRSLDFNIAKNSLDAWASDGTHLN